MCLPDYSHSKILDPLGNPQASIFMSDNSKYYGTWIMSGDVRLWFHNVTLCSFLIICPLVFKAITGFI